MWDSRCCAQTRYKKQLPTFKCHTSYVWKKNSVHIQPLYPLEMLTWLLYTFSIWTAQWYIGLWQSQFCLKPSKTRTRTSLSVWCHHSSLRKGTLLSQIHCIIFVFHTVGWYRGLWLAQAVLAWESWDQLRHQLELANSDAQIKKGGEKKPLYVMSEIMSVSSWFKNPLGKKRSHYDWWRKKKI